MPAMSASMLAQLAQTTKFGPIQVPQITLTAMQSILTLINSNTPNTTSISSLYQTLDTQFIAQGLLDLPTILTQMTTAKLIVYCEMLGVYYAPINGIPPLSSAFILQS